MRKGQAGGTYRCVVRTETIYLYLVVCLHWHHFLIPRSSLTWLYYSQELLPMKKEVINTFLSISGTSPNHFKEHQTVQLFNGKCETSLLPRTLVNTLPQNSPFAVSSSPKLLVYDPYWIPIKWSIHWMTSLTPGSSVFALPSLSRGELSLLLHRA